MLTPEQLIYDLQSQITRLERELEQAQQDIKDFEVLAQEWKKGHEDLKAKHRAEVKNMGQIILEMEDEIEELKAKIKLDG